ncbi:hypothetical protein IQ251_09875 [Saccharopolyspora sp. HNM0983]|uniref:Uncharacterized protein n=1 Tax=Saccharopolyspora montiporae TaxID=2781240 RepID=A0A929G1J6_9PSEU|nr:hypothetical protein [Saccharopolyspora sp. HNM0983]MBE9374753.1 hypothetical protein [Saccharopolyspora sp. HNM0983]
MTGHLRWVVFDYGEVISLPTTALEEMAAMLGAGRDAFADAYYAVRRRRGGPVGRGGGQRAR